MRIFKIYCLSIFQIYNTVLLTMASIWYIISPWHLFFNWTFVPFDPLHPFCQPFIPYLWQSPICSLYLWPLFFVCLVGFCLFVCLFSYIPCIGDIIRYLFFSAWLILLWHGQSFHACSQKQQDFLLFSCLNNTYYIYIYIYIYTYTHTISYYILLLYITFQMNSLNPSIILIIKGRLFFGVKSIFQVKL